MATAKEARHDGAGSPFGHIIAQLDKHTAEHTLMPVGTPRVVHACPPQAYEDDDGVTQSRPT